ncbi:MAG: hypothetical protein RBR08_15515 [Desulforegulaceae bacterium]|nr:hypothetical protein [Desulforegulaceae bacterium]
MTKLQEIDKQVKLLNDKFKNPMFGISSIYKFSENFNFEHMESEYIKDEYSQRDDCWKKPGVYVFLDETGEPIYCGEAARHLWGRVYDYFAKKVNPPFSKMHSRSSFKEVPFGVILYYLQSDDQLDVGMGYALEQRLLGTIDFKYNKKGQRV